MDASIPLALEEDLVLVQTAGAECGLKDLIIDDDIRLTPLTLHLKPLLEPYFRSQKVALFERSFANTVIWCHQESRYYQLIANCLCVFVLRGATLHMPMPPLGEAHAQLVALEKCGQIMARYNGAAHVGNIYGVDSELGALLEDAQNSSATGEAESEKRWCISPGHLDYVYLTEDLVSLRGNQFKSKRSDINQFVRSYPNWRCETLTHQHCAEIMQLARDWLLKRFHKASFLIDEPSYRSAIEEYHAIHQALHSSAHLELTGLVLLLGERIVGFTLGERLSADTASVIFEKTDLHVRGASQIIFRELARVLSDCRFINVGPDLGIETLRKAKLSYHPVALRANLTLHRRASGKRLSP